MTEGMMFKEIIWQVQAVIKLKTLSLKMSGTHKCTRASQLMEMNR